MGVTASARADAAHVRITAEWLSGFDRPAAGRSFEEVRDETCNRSIDCGVSCVGIGSETRRKDSRPTGQRDGIRTLRPEVSVPSPTPMPIAMSMTAPQIAVAQPQPMVTAHPRTKCLIHVRGATFALQLPNGRVGLSS